MEKGSLSENNPLNSVSRRELNAAVNWMNEHREKYYRLGWSYLYDNSDIENAFYNTIIKICGRMNQIKEKEHFEVLTTSTFIEECKNIIREKNKDVIFDDSEKEITVFDSYITVELKDYLNRLDNIQRDIIILKYIAGFSNGEIACYLSLTGDEINSKIHSALLKLGSAVKEV